MAKTPEEVYQEEWKAYLEKADGTLNEVKVKEVLADYSALMEKVTTVYSELTNLSKPHTPPEWIISSVEERYALKSIAFADLAAEIKDGKIEMNIDDLAKYFDIDEFDKQMAIQNLS